MNIDEIAACDADAFLEAAGERAEITYTPPTGGGEARDIPAIITRSPAKPIRASSGKIFTPTYVVEVKNHATDGVSSAVPFQRGKFTVPIRVGHASTTVLTIQQDSLVAQDGGMLTFAFTE
jgi:hypothetical protein